MNELEKSIIQYLTEHPGSTSKEIAENLARKQKDINDALYGSLTDRCYSNAYRWFVHAQKKEIKNNLPPPDPALSSLCKYYLNCLSLESNDGIFTFLLSDKLSYTELKDLSIDETDEEARDLISKVSSDKKNLTAYIGYPIMIEKMKSRRSGSTYFNVAPVFLFPVEINGGSVQKSPIPHVNMEVIKHYSSQDENNRIYDLIQLESELGLDTPDASIDLTDLTARLHSIRKWKWQEPLDPENLSTKTSIRSCKKEGIYNKAVFIVTKRSSYTLGLESELSDLSKLDEASYRNTALYNWVHSGTWKKPISGTDDIPLLEVLPTNTEQEQAIRHALNNQLTIVTGPPGTGKSQVVTSLVINAAWAGKSVLYTSRNN